MINRRIFALGVSAVALGACARRSEPAEMRYVSHLVLYKKERQLIVMSDETVLFRFPVQLGHESVGPKRFYGDGRTPEGLYHISGRNPRSRYHLSLGISYPNQQDRLYARSRGQSAGGDIFLHGTPALYRNRQDWTVGCIALSNAHIEALYAMVADGTPILILP